MKTKIKNVINLMFITTPMLLISGIALADDKKPVLDTGDTAWLLTSTVIVLLMTIPGIALFYGGMVRKRNILATLMQSFTITCLVTVIWMVLGYSLAFSKGAYSFVGNLDLAFLSHLTVGSYKRHDTGFSICYFPGHFCNNNSSTYYGGCR